VFGVAGSDDHNSQPSSRIVSHLAGTTIDFSRS
jgi:hypothetical protein